MLWDRPAKPILHVMCNDPDTGNFTGQAEALCIGWAEFELIKWHAPRFHDDGTAIRLSGKRWPIIRSKEYLGNWCWNGYAIGDTTKTQGWWMVDFAFWLRARGKFRCTHGPAELFDWFNGDYEMCPANVHTALFETLH